MASVELRRQRFNTWLISWQITNLGDTHKNPNQPSLKAADRSFKSKTGIQFFLNVQEVISLKFESKQVNQYSSGKHTESIVPITYYLQYAFNNKKFWDMNKQKHTH